MPVAKNVWMTPKHSLPGNLFPLFPTVAGWAHLPKPACGRWIWKVAPRGWGALGWRLFNKRNIIHTRLVFLVSIHARQVEMEEEESEGEDDAGPCEVFGLLRLPLKPGTASGYVGVQRSASKKRPWQASL